MKNHFRSLKSHNYRLWAMGSVVSYIGTWMQRVAQSWLVLTELTPNDATAVGIVTGLQYAPLLLLLPWSGAMADRIDRRKLLLMTQALMGLLSAILGVMILIGAVALWHVYIFAFVFGAVTAFDTPASHAFAGDLVGDDDLSNAVALNSTAFNSARLIGPGLAGLLIAWLGTGWAFVINAGSFAAVIVALLMMRGGEFHRWSAPVRQSGIMDGLRYTLRHRELRSALLMLFFVGTFALNFPLFISTMTVKVFGEDATRYGLLMSIMAFGSLAGAFIAAGVQRPTMRQLFLGALLLSVGFATSAVSPSYWVFAVALIVVGGAAVTFTTSTNSFMQLESDVEMRGRVIALRVAVAVGGAPVASPLLGWVAQYWGPRWLLAIAAGAAGFAALIALSQLSKASGQKPAHPFQD